MNTDATRWLLFILIILLPTAAVADKERSGTLRGGVYTAPDKSFQFKVPKLVDPGTFVRDVRVSDDTFEVVMGDELCRRVFIVQHAAESFADSDTFAREATMNMVDSRTRPIDSAYGDTTITTGAMPQASVCMAMTFNAEGQMVPSPGEGSDAGIYSRRADVSHGWAVLAGLPDPLPD